jgi:hypothetical protein
MRGKGVPDLNEEPIGKTVGHRKLPQEHFPPETREPKIQGEDDRLVVELEKEGPKARPEPESDQAPRITSRRRWELPASPALLRKRMTRALAGNSN